MTFSYTRERRPRRRSNPVPGTVGDDGRWDPDAARGTAAG